MNKAPLLLGLALIWAVGQTCTAEPADAQPRRSPAASPKASRVIAYYFHGTIRCVTCLKIERQSREIMKREFSPEVATKRLVFKSVNYDLPANAHYAEEYKLPCPSLVLVRQQNDKDVKWKLLGKTWEHIENPIEFEKYIKTETARFLNTSPADSKAQSR